MTSSPALLLVDDADVVAPPQLASWHYQHLERTIQDEQLTPFGLHRCPPLSFPAAGEKKEPAVRAPAPPQAEDADSASSASSSLTLSASTSVSFLYRNTRLVLLLDVSPSISIIDSSTFRPLYSTLLDTVALLLRHLASSAFLCCSCLYLSIVASNPASSTPLYVIVQCCLLTADTVDAVLEMVTTRLMEVENCQAEAQQLSNHRRQQQRAGDSQAHQLHAEQLLEQEDDRADDDGSLVPPSAPFPPPSISSLHLLLHQSLFFLDRLPICASPSVLLVTDSVFPPSASLPSHSSMLSLLLRRGVRVSALQLTSAVLFSSFCFGYVADSEAVQDICRATGGVFAGQEEMAAMTERGSDGAEPAVSVLEQAVFLRGSALQPVRETADASAASGLLPTLRRQRGRAVSISAAASATSPIASLLSASSFTLAASASVASSASSASFRSASFASVQPLSPPFAVADSVNLHRERVKRYSMDVDVTRCLECRQRDGFLCFPVSSSSLLLMRRQLRDAVHVDYLLMVGDEVKPEHGESEERGGGGGEGGGEGGARRPTLRLKKRRNRAVRVELWLVARRAVLDAVWLLREAEAEKSRREAAAGREKTMQAVEAAAGSLHGAAREQEAAAIWSFLSGLQQADALLLHLSRISMTKVEEAFTHARSEIMMRRADGSSGASSFSAPSLPSVPAASTRPQPPSPPFPVSVTFPALPPFLASSYLSPSHPLWQQLSSFPVAALRRFFPLQVLSILCSLHRTSQLEQSLELELELELEIDFASLTRARKEGDADAELVNGGEAQAGRSGLGQQEVAETLCRLLAGWSSIAVSNACFVFFPPPPPPQQTVASAPSAPAEAALAAFESCSSSSTPFALLRLTWRTKFLASLTIAYHACDPATRAAVLHGLQALISSAYISVPREEGRTRKRSSGEREAEVSPPRWEPADGREDEELLLSRVSSAVPGTPESPSPPPPAHDVLCPFGVVRAALDSRILRPSMILASAASAALFQTLFPAAQSSSLSSIVSFSASRQSLSLLRCYQRHHTWTWQLPSSVSMKSAMRLLRGARAEEGFVLVASTGRASVWLRELQITQADEDEKDWSQEQQEDCRPPRPPPFSPPSRHQLLLRSASTPSLVHPPLSPLNHAQSFPPDLLSSTRALSPSPRVPCPRGAPSSCLLQYAVTELDATHLQTELWLEPFFGRFHFLSPPLPSASRPAASYAALTSEQLFLHLSSWMHSSDLHSLSALSTFDSIRDLELEVDTAQHMQSRGGGAGVAAAGGAVAAVSSGLRLHLVDDFHSQPGFDYDDDSRQRMLCRFSSASCHPMLLLSIGTITRVKGLLRIGSGSSALYASLGAHAGSAVDLHSLERAARASSIALIAQHATDDLRTDSLSVGRDSSAGGQQPADSEDEFKRLTSPSLTPAGSRSFALTSPLFLPASARPPVSPVVSPLPAVQLLSSLLTGRADDSGGDVRSPTAGPEERAEDRRQRRSRRKRKRVPLSLSYLLETSSASSLLLPFPSSTASAASASSSPHLQPEQAGSSATFAELPQSQFVISSPSPPVSAIRVSHAYSQSLSSLPDPPRAGAGSPTVATVRRLNGPLARSTTISPSHRMQRPAQAQDGREETAAAVLRCMLVQALRRLSDVELVKGRCFAQLVNEYTILIVLLPAAVAPARDGKQSSHGFRLRRRRSSETMQAEDEDGRRREDGEQEQELLSYLDQLLALHDDVGCSEDEHRGNLRVALYESSRDELRHPRSLWHEELQSTALPPSISVSSFPSSSSTPSPATSPPHSPQPQTPQQSETLLQPPPPSLPSHPALTLTDGRSSRQLSSKQAVALAQIRTAAIRYLLCTAPLVLRRPEPDAELLQALALALGTASVQHSAPSPGPDREAQSPVLSPLLSPHKSPALGSRREGGSGSLLTSPVTRPLTAFKLDETVDDSAVRRTLFEAEEKEQEEEEQEELSDALLRSGSSTRSHSGLQSVEQQEEAVEEEEEETQPAASCSAVFASRLMAAHLRNYVTAVYVTARRDATAVTESDLQLALSQCLEFVQQIDISELQRAGVEDGSTAESARLSAVSGLQAALQELMQAEQWQQLSTTETYVDVSACRPANDSARSAAGSAPSQPADPITTQPLQRSPLSRSRALPPPSTGSSATDADAAAQSAKAAAGGGHKPEDGTTGGRDASPRPLFLQLRAVLRPSQCGLQLLAFGPPSSSPPKELEMAVTAETDLSELAVAMLGYQQPDWWQRLTAAIAEASDPETEGDADSRQRLRQRRAMAAVQCMLELRAFVLGDDGEGTAGVLPVQDGSSSAGHGQIADVLHVAVSPPPGTRSMAEPAGAAQVGAEGDAKGSHVSHPPPELQQRLLSICSGLTAVLEAYSRITAQPA